MSQTVLDKTTAAIGESARQTSSAGSAVAAITEEGVGVVRRAARPGGDAAKEILNDTTRRIQRQPALTVALTFAVGFAAGVLICLIMKQR
jgi:ElaB/YqjD/DUF883 family membrane-anchored ribosome-binding protein